MIDYPNCEYHFSHFISLLIKNDTKISVNCTCISKGDLSLFLYIILFYSFVNIDYYQFILFLNHPCSWFEKLVGLKIILL